MTERTPAETISAGLAATGDQRAERRARQSASDFKTNPTYDQLLELRDNHDPRWVDAGRSVRLAAVLYEQQRQIAADHGVDTTQPPAAA